MNLIIAPAKGIAPKVCMSSGFITGTGINPFVVQSNHEWHRRTSYTRFIKTAVRGDMGDTVFFQSGSHKYVAARGLLVDVDLRRIFLLIVQPKGWDSFMLWVDEEFDSKDGWNQSMRSLIRKEIDTVVRQGMRVELRSRGDMNMFIAPMMLENKGHENIEWVKKVVANAVHAKINS